MRNMLVEKNWINLVAALSLAILPILMVTSHPASSNATSKNNHVVQMAESSTE